MEGEPRFDDAEKTAIVAEYDRVAARGQPPNSSVAGVVVLVFAFLVFLGLPALESSFGVRLPGLLSVGLLGVLVVAGVALWIHGASRPYRVIRRRVEEAIDALSGYPRGDPSEMRHAATVLVFDAHYSGRPGTEATYDFAKVASRLGAALPYVRAIERVIRTSREAACVFTSDGVGSQGA